MTSAVGRSYANRCCAVSFYGAWVLGGVGGPSSISRLHPWPGGKFLFAGDSGSEYVCLITQLHPLRSAGMLVGLGLHLVYTSVAWWPDAQRRFNFHAITWLENELNRDSYSMWNTIESLREWVEWVLAPFLRNTKQFNLEIQGHYFNSPISFVTSCRPGCLVTCSRWLVRPHARWNIGRKCRMTLDR